VGGGGGGGGGGGVVGGGGGFDGLLCFHRSSVCPFTVLMSFYVIVLNF